ncbi:acyl carrier protein, partial [Pseudomonas sp. HMWF011]
TAVQLQSIWTEVLNQQTISSDSHFFERGATSLSVMMLLGRIANLFNVYLSPKDIFDHPVLAQQVTLLGEGASHGAENAMLLDAYAWRRRVGEQTPGLAQLEILDKPAQTPAYLENVVLAFYIKGTCSAIRVREAFATVLA